MFRFDIFSLLAQVKNGALFLTNASAFDKREHILSLLPSILQINIAKTCLLMNNRISLERNKTFTSQVFFLLIHPIKILISLLEQSARKKGWTSKELKPISESQNKQKNIITSPSFILSLFTLINHLGMFTSDISLID